MISLQISIPGHPPLTRRISFGQHTIGRGLSADIRIKHDSVSRKHAQLSITETDTSIRDIGGNKALRRKGAGIISQAVVHPGDVFMIGDCEVMVLPEDATTEDPPSTVPRPLPAQPLTGEVTMLAEISKTLPIAAAAVPSRHVTPDSTAEIMGYGPLEPFLADESVSEVMVNGPKQIYIEREGRLTSVPTQFVNSDSLMRLIERIVSPLGRRIDESVPMVDARLPDGSRVNAIIPPLSLVGPVLTIRKLSKPRFTMDRLVELGSLTQEMAEFLQLCVRNRKNILVSGGAGSGKTAFLNALCASIPATERIVTIEDAAELRLDQRHVISLEARPANVEGSGEIPIRKLVRNALRMRPDRIIVGECRGGEVLDMLQAMNTGHDGSLTTSHANSPRDLLSRLEVMVLMAGMELPERAIREQISSAVDIIVQKTRFADGSRRVTSIVEIDGMEGDAILIQPLFAFKQRGVSATGEIQGEHVGCGQAPRFHEDLTESGIALDHSVFGACAKPNQCRA